MIRQWVKEFLQCYFSHSDWDGSISQPPSHFLLEAPPGSGKTRAAYEAIKIVMDHGWARRFIVVGPTRNVIQQWGDAGRYYDCNVSVSPRTSDWVHRFQGASLTYAQDVLFTD